MSFTLTISDVDLELLYFDIEGKAEALRLICAYTGLPLKDTRLSRDEFMKLKTSGFLSYGQVPCLLVVDKRDSAVASSQGTTTTHPRKICQSAAIARFLGRLAAATVSSDDERVYPSHDLVLAGLIDSIIDQEVDLFGGLQVCRYKARYGFGFLADEDNQALLDAAYAALDTEVLPRHLEFFERVLIEGGTDWLAGTKRPSICDFVLAPRIKWFKQGQDPKLRANIIDDFPMLCKWLQTFYAIPEVVKYYEARANK